MSVEQTPLASECGSECASKFSSEGPPEEKETEATYDLWFRAKVEEALHSTQPRLPHDAAVARVKSLLQERRQARAARPLVR